MSSSENNYGTFRERVLGFMSITRSDYENRPQRRRSFSFASEVDVHSPFRFIEHMQGRRYDSDEEEENERRKERTNCGIIDYSEPFLYILSILNAVSLVYIAISDFSVFMIVVMLYAIMITFLAIWRVRKLGIAKSLMDSVNAFKLENTELKNNVHSLNTEVTQLKNLSSFLQEQTTELEDENKKLMKISGLLGDNVEDLEETKRVLINELRKIEQANSRYEANNLMNLFFLVDRDQGGTLSEEELIKMNTYVTAVYGVDIDVISMDKNSDGKVDIKEFVSRFEKQIAKKANELTQEKEDSIPDLVDIEIHGDYCP